MNPETKNCKNCKQNFLIEVDDFSFYEKMGVPAPTWCPDCRQTRRMMFRNFKTLYKRPSSKSEQSIISMYNPDVSFPVYEAREWWADDWDAVGYGRAYDPSKAFFEQLGDLFDVVPRMALMNTKSADCEYANMTYGSSNCYLVFGCVEDEECDYGHIVWNSKNCVDNLYVFKCEFCYECVDCLNCNQVFYSQESESCADSIGLFDCRGCADCIGCVGLRSKSYHIFNQPVSKEEYKAFLGAYPLSDPKTIQYIFEKRKELEKVIPKPEFFGSHNVDVSGNHIYDSHNVHHSYDIKGGENSKYGYTVKKMVDSYDVSFSPSVEKSYEDLNCVGSGIVGSHLVVDSNDVFYSDSCFGCSNLFGCAGLRQKSYFILNKQYTKEEYEKLVTQIIENMKKMGEWGEFLPIKLSSFTYNESIANEYKPKTKEEAIALGFAWRDDIPSTSGQETINHNDLPKNPEDFNSKELVAHILKCSACSKNYKLIEREVTFYRRYKLLIPEKCFNCRHANRMSMRNERALVDRLCGKCGKAIKTSYKDDSRDTKIFCIECYQQEIV